ncbi:MULTISPECIES: polysaccharide biosynthesis/export family protein [unclassified Shimia]|uniref:polysaccharide biosynthesis/export family protein n=1 Tax=unclassified Shimia TaxID=2630038 RepID=UPI0031026648
MVGLAGCSTLPGQGPGKATIAVTHEVANQENVERDFAMVPVTTDTIDKIGGPQKVGFAGSLASRSSSTAGTSIRVGDRLTVRVWESSPEGLFSTSDQKSSAIPVIVSNDGNINIPYVGDLEVLGMTVDQVREHIAEGLRGKAVDPEVSVILEKNGAQSVTVVGDARSPGQFDIPASGLRLLDAVAIAKGASQATHDMEISLMRGTSTAKARLDEVISNASANVWLQPRDTVQLLHNPRTFSAFGAVKKPSQQPFQTERVTLAEAISKVGGLQDNLADDSGVFLFRFETAARVQSTGAKMPKKTYAMGVPTIYWLDLTTPESIFMTQAFTMRDKDVLFVANAPSTDLAKFTALVLATLAIAS